MTNLIKKTKAELVAIIENSETLINETLENKVLDQETIIRDLTVKLNNNRTWNTEKAKTIEALGEIIELLTAKNAELAKTNKEAKNTTQNTLTGRKAQVVECLKEGLNTIAAIANKLEVKKANVSSVLTYLRQENWPIKTEKCGTLSIITLGELETETTEG